MNYWAPSHLNLLPGQDHVAPPHPLIFPGFPFVKTRVLCGRVDIYGVLALVWIWDRLRVQTWTGQCGSSPRLVHAPSFWAGARGKDFPDCPVWVVQEKQQLWVTDSTRRCCVWERQESTTELLLSGHTSSKDTGKGREKGKQARIKIPNQLRETRWVLKQCWGLCGGTETFRRQFSLKMQSGCHFSTSLLA